MNHDGVEDDEGQSVNLSTAHNIYLVAPIMAQADIHLREIMRTISGFREVIMQRLDGDEVSLLLILLILKTYQYQQFLMLHEFFLYLERSSNEC